MLFVAVIMSVSLIQLPARSASHISQTDTLNKLGLFLGTGGGYELERAPMRSEAAVMLVRLLGKEPEVKAGTYTHPFKDVPAWADKYVGYLYQNGLTKGTSATTFEPTLQCDWTMYSVFVLRSLGYTEANGSFVYSGAVAFAESLGLLLSGDADDTFLRDDMVAESYAALFTPQKNSGVLLAKLVSDGAVTNANAAPLLELYSTYEDYAEACRASHIEASTETLTTTSSEITMAGTYQKAAQSSSIKTVLNNGKVILQGLDRAPDNSVLQYYYADGWMYVNDGTDSYKYRTEITRDDYIAGINVSPAPFSLISSISKTTADGNVTYTVGYTADAFKKLFGTEMSELRQSLGAFSVTVADLGEVTVFDSNGNMKTQTATGRVLATIIADSVSYSASIKFSSSNSLETIGDTVTASPTFNLDACVDITDQI
jgi:hypothetical protein